MRESSPSGPGGRPPEPTSEPLMQNHGRRPRRRRRHPANEAMRMAGGEGTTEQGKCSIITLRTQRVNHIDNMSMYRKWSEAFHLSPLLEVVLEATWHSVFDAAFTVDMKMEWRKEEGLVFSPWTTASVVVAMGVGEKKKKKRGRQMRCECERKGVFI